MDAKTTKTVRVRIAVAVDGKGNYHGYCQDNLSDHDNMEEAIGNVLEGCGVAMYFVEADLALPFAIDVAGVVTDEQVQEAIPPPGAT